METPPRSPPVDPTLMKDLETRTFESFGSLARYLRERTGLAPTTLARKMGLGRGYGSVIRNVEEGRRLPSVNLVPRYLRYFDLSPSYVLA